MNKVQQVLSRLAEDVISLYDDFDDGKITHEEYQEEMHNLIMRYEDRVYAEISQEDYVFHRILDALKKYKKEVS
ncbi:MAG: hypothetical protein DRI61_11335 [Chloroflexi bacterium]|nr:MAG: hypothetical protein DRI61_11335 [Chloroflexota bacterium]